MYFVTVGKSRTRAKTSFGTKKAALEHARFALAVGATVACVIKRSPVTGNAVQVKCVRRAKSKALPLTRLQRDHRDLWPLVGSGGKKRRR